MKRDSAKLTIRNDRARVVRASVLKQIEASWERQGRRPLAEEIDGWILARPRDLLGRG